MSDHPIQLAKPASILLVDDVPSDLAFLHALLEPHYRLQDANDGKKALELANATPSLDLILLSTSMADMSDYAVCRQLKTDPATRDIPVLFLSADIEAEDTAIGFELGAADYISKPANAAIVLARVQTHLLLKASADFLRNHNQFLEAEVARRTQEIGLIQDVVIMAMASMAETRDADTGNHIRRTQRYVKALAWKLSTHPRFKGFLTLHHIGLLFKAAPLHDIGKVGIPDRILLKPGKLTPEEFEIMKTHTTLGRDALAHAEEELGAEITFLTLAKEIAYSHQEKWDGSGYPNGLKGDEIPISARLMAVADVYDALISRRVYKEPLSHEQACTIIAQTSGRHFDPDVVAAFMAIEENFHAIALSYADSEADIKQKIAYLEISKVTPR